MKPIILPSNTVHSGELILVNAQAALVVDGTQRRECVWVNPDSAVRLERVAAASLNRLMKELDGWRWIMAVSGWRSHHEQQEIFAQSLRDNGREFTEKYVALPGHSEHQTGLAIDLGLRTEQLDFIRPAFPYAGICQTFRKMAPAFGFIERYPKGKEEVTGIAHEPWHFRYVGKPHAEIMAGLGLTLEEYHAFLKQYPFGEKDYVYRSGREEVLVSYIAADDETPVVSEDTASYSLSGNNVDGFVLTRWRERNGG